jgi:hypothetical protein
MAQSLGIEKEYELVFKAGQNFKLLKLDRESSHDNFMKQCELLWEQFNASENPSPVQSPTHGQ